MKFPSKKVFISLRSPAPCTQLILEVTRVTAVVGMITSLLDNTGKGHLVHVARTIAIRKHIHLGVTVPVCFVARWSKSTVRSTYYVTAGLKVYVRTRTHNEYSLVAKMHNSYRRQL